MKKDKNYGEFTESGRKYWRIWFISATAATAFVSLVFLNSAENKDAIENMTGDKINWSEYNNKSIVIKARVNANGKIYCYDYYYDKTPLTNRVIPNNSKSTDLFSAGAFGVLALISAWAANGVLRKKENQH